MDKRMLMLTVELGKAERVVHLASRAGASGATILHCREMLPEPGPFQLEPQRDLVIMVIDSDIQAAVEESIQAGFEQKLTIYCVPILDSVGLDRHLTVIE